MGVIKINDIRVHANHGCMDEEARIGGEYIVHIELETDMERAMASDRLDDTIDYVVVHDIVFREMKERSKLIEHVAGRILGALHYEIKGLLKAKVEVVKLSPPIGGNVASVSVVVER